MRKREFLAGWIVVPQSRSLYLVGMDEARESGLRRPYEAPTLKVVGSVSALTLQQDKKYGATDGFTFMGVPITNASP